MIAAAIVHKPGREGSTIDEMLRRLSSPAILKVAVVDDVAPLWDCWLKAVTSIPDECSHILVCQDDIKFCTDFVENLDRITAVYPDRIVNFFSTLAGVEEADDRGDHWLQTYANESMYNQCVLWPKTLVRKLEQWVKAGGVTADMNLKHDDRIIGVFLRSLSREEASVMVTVPSLVEHTAPNQSSLGYNNKNKVARWYIGDERSALSVPWYIKPKGAKHVR